MPAPAAYERTIAANMEIEIEVRKSRFICSVARVTSEAEARATIEAARRRHWDANHHCTAWRIGPAGRLQRTSDDGEPAGTAGVPMLDVLARRDLTDTVAVVTRYFGGTRLGAGGLIRAYGAAVSAAVDRAGVVERRPVHVIEVAVGHAESGRVEHALRTSDFGLAKVSYNAGDVTLTVRLEPERRESFRTWLAELTAGRGEAREMGVELIEVPIER